MTVDDTMLPPEAEPSVDGPGEATASGSPAGRWSRGRLLTWAGGGVAAIAVTIGVVLLVSGRSAGLDPAAEYVGADAVVYMEVRLDLPGEQRELLEGILDRFPGIAVDEVMGEALADTIDEALASAEAPVDYSGDIAPWFTGHVAFALNTFPATSCGGAMDGPMEIPSMTILFGTRDADAAETAVDAIRGSMEDDGITFTSADHDGITLWTAEMSAPELGAEAATIEVAVTEDQVVVGVNGGGEAALDVHAGHADALARKPDLSQLIDRLPGERVATFVGNLTSMLEFSYPQSPLPSAVAAAMVEGPGLAAGSISFEADAMRVDGVSGPIPDGAPTSTLGPDLAAEIPGDAVFFEEAPAFGETMELAVESVKASACADPTTEQMLAGLETMESALGVSLDDYFDWAGSLALAVGNDGGEPWGGVIFEASDHAAAEQRIGQLDALLTLGASDPRSGMEVTHSTMSGVEVTRLRIIGDPMSALPFTDLVIEFALTDDRLLLGIGDAFIQRALDLEAGDSLAESTTYGRALTALGDDARAAIFVDLGAIREWVESVLPTGMPEYERDIAPNLAPFDYLVMGGRMDGRFAISTILLKLN